MEVLAYSESQKNISNINERKYFSSQYNSGKGSNKYETAAKLTKKLGSKETSMNSLYQKNSKKVVNNSDKLPMNSRSNSSLIPQPSSTSLKSNSKQNTEKKPTPLKATVSHTPSPAINKVQSAKSVSGPNKLSSGASKKPVGSRNNSPRTNASTTTTKVKSNNSVSSAKTVSSDSLKIDDHIQSESGAKGVEDQEGPPSETRSAPMISEGGVRDSGALSDVSHCETVERVFSQQLARGKLQAPTAKFRADDEISIGETDAGDAEMVDKRNSINSVSSDRSSSVKCPVTPVSRNPRSSRLKDARTPDAYPPSQASLLVAKFLEEGGGRSRTEKTNSLPLNSALVTFDERSTSLGQYYKTDKHQQQTKNSSSSSSEGFFQRLSNLRRSFNTADHKKWSGGSAKIRPHITDANNSFFQGISEISAKRPSVGGRQSHRSHHSSILVLPPLIKSYKPPPRKHQFQRSQPVKTTLSRSFSFSDCRVIAQCVVDNDVAVLGELFPAFLNSGDNIYTVIDKDKLNKPVDECNKSVKLRHVSKTNDDTTASEHTLIGDNSEAITDDNDKNDEAGEASRLVEAGSELTLTSSSIVNINNMTGESSHTPLISTVDSANLKTNPAAALENQINPKNSSQVSTNIVVSALFMQF